MQAGLPDQTDVCVLQQIFLILLGGETESNQCDNRAQSQVNWIHQTVLLNWCRREHTEERVTGFNLSLFHCYLDNKCQYVRMKKKCFIIPVLSHKMRRLVNEMHKPDFDTDEQLMRIILFIIQIREWVYLAEVSSTDPLRWKLCSCVIFLIMEDI